MLTKEKKRSPIKLIVWLLLLLVVLLGVGFWYLGRPVGGSDVLQAFVITKDQSVDSIAKSLAEAGLVRSDWMFRFNLKSSGKEEKIQTGTFKLSPNMSYGEIIEKLTGPADDRWVTLLEGWRIEEMADKLSSELGPSGNFSKEEFLQLAKEGYMFPDTYLFNKDAKTADVVARIRNNFDAKVSDEMSKKYQDLGLSLNGAVILASIVEREARSDAVRRQVASILLHRLNIGMGLNADATVQYALGYQPEAKSWWKRHLSLDDLKVDSPYNSYVHRGLPPGAIANPSLSSLLAVANADPSTPYLYYYHDSEGNSYYASSLEEHNANVASHP